MMARHVICGLLGTLPGIAYGYLTYSYLEGQIAPAVIAACLGAFIGSTLSFRAASKGGVDRGAGDYSPHGHVLYLPDIDDGERRKGDSAPSDANSAAAETTDSGPGFWDNVFDVGFDADSSD